jgi:hypothetical protein
LADAAAAFFERKTAFLVEITTKKPAPLCVEQAFWGVMWVVRWQSGLSTLDDTHQDHHQGDHQQKMDQSSQSDR